MAYFKRDLPNRALHHARESVTRSPASYNWHRLEPRARAVTRLTDYYTTMESVAEWEAEIPALMESARSYAWMAEDVRQNATGRMIADYPDDVRVQSTHDTDPHLATILRREAELLELEREREVLVERAEALVYEAYNQRRGWAYVGSTLSYLTPLQYKVVDRRHREHKPMWELAVDMHYETVTLEKVYQRALDRLVKIWEEDGDGQV